MTKELVAISKKTGHLIILVPLHVEPNLETSNGYSLTLFRHAEPVAYVIFVKEEINGTVLAAEVVEKYVEILGDL